MENHIARRIIPGEYEGRLNPLEDNVWVFLHSYPLSEVDRTYAVTTYPEVIEDTVIEEGVLPMLECCFGIPILLENCHVPATPVLSLSGLWSSWSTCNHNVP
jgi:hypothetical protein